ncbi:hypothetical protein [Anaeromyxobacter oryzae]|uniref:Lipoprotein n=1 Tax=Anaeromyxobacter oryzae TaxID=2918170 RepID=A0ABM7WQZ7_9BACT|nr:hypothetical protein [Anaeromyxobacter oryzae]BDG01881.1 hypothetical protein AMOR_08770 [Anaeromyxobacter oryzae]
MRLVAAVVALLAAGCATSPAVDPSVRLRPETRPECAAHCEQLGMRLGAVVLIKNAAGCVCQPREAPPAQGTAAPPASEPRAEVEGGGAAVTGGALVIALEEEARQRNATAGQPQPTTHTPPSWSSPGGYHH